MKLANYFSTDIEEAIEIKKMIHIQLENIKRCNWTDEIEEALIRTDDLKNSLSKLREMKIERVLDDGTNSLVSRLKSQGVYAQAFKFTHKKAD
ncbi:Uncharacterised protein [Lysinibacillus sphaericus]|nr:Uncharacterised protein [Lysinibacillus sphaericus]